MDFANGGNKVLYLHNYGTITIPSGVLTLTNVIGNVQTLVAFTTNGSIPRTVIWGRSDAGGGAVIRNGTNEPTRTHE